MSEDRRQYKRLPLTLSVATPIKIVMHSEDNGGILPGILVNLSAGGMALILFQHLPEGSRIEFSLDFMGIQRDIKGRISRVEKKFEDTYMVGIRIEKVSEKLKEVVEKMAEDQDICQIRYVMDPDTACFPECSFRALCARRIKKDFPEVENDTA